MISPASKRVHFLCLVGLITFRPDVVDVLVSDEVAFVSSMSHLETSCSLENFDDNSFSKPTVISSVAMFSCSITVLF